MRFVARDAIKRQLDNDNIVLLSNLGFTAAGEVLNCNTYDVGLHAAMELNADKLICLHLDDVKGGLVRPLDDAHSCHFSGGVLLKGRTEACCCQA